MIRRFPAYTTFVGLTVGLLSIAPYGLMWRVWQVLEPLFDIGPVM